MDTALEINPSENEKRPSQQPPAELSDVWRAECDRFLKALRRVSRKQSTRRVHECRISGRRVVASIDGLKEQIDSLLMEKVRREVRKLCKRLGELRDLQVQRSRVVRVTGEGEAREQLLDIITERIAKDKKRTARKAASVDIARLRKRMRGVERLLAKRSLAEHRTRAVAGIERSVALAIARIRADVRSGATTRVERLHDLRLHFKGLRYLLETMGSLNNTGAARAAEILREYQSELGEVQDDSVLLELLSSLRKDELLSHDHRVVLSRQVSAHRTRLIRGFNSKLEEVKQALEYAERAIGGESKLH